MIPPWVQAKDWFGLVTDDDIAALNSGPQPDFKKTIDLIHQRCAEDGKQLVIRDWNHLDFLALPFLDTQPNRLCLIDSLRGSYDIKQLCLVRHPLDQSQSIRRLQIWQKYGETEFKLLLRSMRLFAEHAARIGFVRYEDFARNHEKELGEACKKLGLPYDQNYSRNWQDYDKITGNVSGSRGGTSQIQILPRRQIPKLSADYLLSSADYRTTCELLGYDP